MQVGKKPGPGYGKTDKKENLVPGDVNNGRRLTKMIREKVKV